MAEKEETKTKETKAASTKASEEGSGLNASEFMAGAREELGKIVWPSRQQLISESVAVLLMVIVSATLIYLVDNLFSWASHQVF
ncbi:preprotein translocase subunit SecE [Leptolyngbya sp. FACHB-16]|nr:preprotein translocase subunit SecE [Leptolyngbya sp. FACHB-8]MBD2153575.1 preprotein translocase subunit SecE [Leptolyngbya sp. FACHB-16]